MLEGLDLRAIRSLPVPLLDRIHRNQVHVALELPAVLHAADELHKLHRFRLIIVDTLDDGILEGHPSTGLLEVVLDGRHDLRERIFVCDRHQGLPCLVVRRMQAECQCDPVVFIRQLPDLRHQTAGRDRDVPSRDMESVFIRDHADETGELIVVVKRFAGAHDDDVIDPGTGRTLDLVDLSEHLSARQIPCEAVERRCTELAAHAAADLGGDTDTVPVLVLHPDGLDDMSVLHTEDKFLRTIDL